LLQAGTMPEGAQVGRSEPAVAPKIFGLALHAGVP
jgi:hypothetical protein